MRSDLVTNRGNARGVVAARSRDRSRATVKAFIPSYSTSIATFFGGGHGHSHNGTALHAAHASAKLCRRPTPLIDRLMRVFFTSTSENNGLNRVTFTVVFGSLLRPRWSQLRFATGETIPSMSPAGQQNRPNSGYVFWDSPCDSVPSAVCFSEHFPWVAHGLFQTKETPTLAPFDFPEPMDLRLLGCEKRSCRGVRFFLVSKTFRTREPDLSTPGSSSNKCT